MTAAIAKARLTEVPITFAAYGLHFRASGKAPARVEDWVCGKSAEQVSDLHNGLLRAEHPKLLMTRSQATIVAQAMAWCHRMESRLDAVEVRNG